MFTLKNIQSCCFKTPLNLTFLNFDSKTEFAYGKINQGIQKQTVRLGLCDSYDYYEFPDLISEMANNNNMQCTTKRYDSRSFYRTWTSQNSNEGYYVGTKYTEPPNEEKDCCKVNCCKFVCCCCDCSSSQNHNTNKNNDCKCNYCSCCCCCFCCSEKPQRNELIDPYRIFSPIYNLETKSEKGQFVFCHFPGKCCKSERNFFEINFSENANLIMRIGLISGFFSLWYFKELGNLLENSYTN